MPDEHGQLTREEVILAYRLMLSRDPENEQVIELHRRHWRDPVAFGRALAESEEFRRRLAPVEGAALPLDVAANSVEHAADDAALARLFEPVQRYWEAIGRTQPHWSVLPEARFLPENIAGTAQDFAASGAEEARVIEAALARLGRAAESFAHAVEQGCGLGRVTRHLAGRFGQLTAVDVSLPHLRLAAQALAEAGIEGVTFAQAVPGKLVPVTGCDLWLSHRTLQHNPPPLQRALLRAAFQALAPGGVAIFQAATWMEDFTFDTPSYLAGRNGAQMELHALPQPVIFDLAAEAGMALREVREDQALAPWPRPILSNRFVMVKRG
jgi:SAM-dependent methyltransferase